VRTELEHPEGGSRSLSTARCEKRSVRRPEVRVGKALDPLLQKAFLPRDEPPKCSKTVQSATDGEQAAPLALVREAKDFLDDRSHPDGYNIGVNVGTAAGQTVMHLHVIPRYAGDMADPRGGVRGVIPERRGY